MNRQQRRAQGKPKAPPKEPAATTGAELVRMGWESYRDAMIPAGVDEVQMIETKRAIYAGMFIGINIPMAITGIRELSEDQVAEMLEQARKAMLAQSRRAGEDDELTNADWEKVRRHGELEPAPDADGRLPALPPGVLPETCCVKDCELESAWQVGAAFKFKGQTGAMVEAWTGLTECDEHKGFTTVERLFPGGEQWSGWQQIAAGVSPVGQPDFSTVTIRRRGL